MEVKSREISLTVEKSICARLIYYEAATREVETAIRAQTIIITQSPCNGADRSDDTGKRRGSIKDNLSPLPLPFEATITTDLFERRGSQSDPEETPVRLENLLFRR